ncbi:hypothetical protein [uncultured Muribaculum sp.]|uniref:hypothetical protein n=1 Tax=uncultured Muribaculum sp. TaxID=1918613 RepID=UPI0026062DCD|nr:hypothetical protein [uncultured Muribaculum sp.]
MSIMFIQTHAEGRDCTAPYDVVFGEPYTVRGFINEILKRREWGKISISTHQGSHILIEYGCNGLKEQLPEPIVGASVTKVQAAGGWSRMDYRITALENRDYADKN